MDNIIELIFILLESNIVYLIVGATLAYFPSVWASDRKKRHETKLKLAADFIEISFLSLKHLDPNINQKDAYRDKFELIKISELIGLFYSDKCYRLAKDYSGYYAMQLQKYLNESITGEISAERDMRVFTTYIEEIRALLKKEI